MKQLPNILTLANLFCGALAAIFILQAPSFISSFNGQDFLVTAPPPIYWASVLIGLAAVFDFLDGLVARWMKVSSPMGKELDSLADVITFGLAPGLILYQLLRTAYLRQPGAMDTSVWMLLPALLVPCFAAYRLAKFNLDELQKVNFLGLPTPAAGLFVASLPLVILYEHSFLNQWLQQVWVLYLLILGLCVLMVCNIPFFSLKMKNLSWKENGLRYILILLVLASIPFIHWSTVPFAFALYVVLSVGKNWFFPD